MNKLKLLLERLATPAGPASLALALGFVHVVLHVAGWRGHTAFLSGTVTGDSPGLAMLFGLLYLGSYFAWVVGTPILFGAALLMALSERLWPGRR